MAMVTYDDEGNMYVDEVFPDDPVRTVSDNTLLDESTTIIIKGLFACSEESTLIDDYNKIAINVHDHNCGRMVYTYVPKRALNFLVKHNSYTFTAHYFEHPTRVKTYTTVVTSILDMNGNEIL